MRKNARKIGERLKKNKMVDNKEMENGKAIIQLAQIVMILAGFIIATGGIAYTSSINSLSTTAHLINSQSFQLAGLSELNLSEDTIELIKMNVHLSSSYLNTIPSQLDLMKSCFYMGFLFAFVSLLIWGIGYWKINKARDKK
jgi:hypothetical protein